MQGEFYNRYNTPLTPDERKGLYSFLMDLSMRDGRNAFNDLNNYDMAGAYQVGRNEQGGNGHFTDAYKKPNHPTFSDESQYHGIDGHYGGHWDEGVEGWSFTPSAWNLENLPPEDMKRYFAEHEPEARLILPNETGNGGNDDMAVIYAQKNGGGLGGFLGPLSLVSAFVPGLQPVAAGLNAVNSAAQGDIGGALLNGAKALGGQNAGAAKPGGTKVNLQSNIDNPNYAARNLSAMNQNNARQTAQSASAQYSDLTRPYSRSLGLGEIGVNDALRAFLGRI